MPVSRPIPNAHASSCVPAFHRQRTENTGPKSLPTALRVVAGGTLLRTAGRPEAADLAGRNAAVAWRRRYLEWLETGRARSSADLLPHLPLQDAVTLAALAGTGRMTWAEINAALDAMIKRAAAHAHDGAAGEPSAAPSGKKTADDEIWARYHAQCDEVFAGASLPADKADGASAQLWRTERVLNRLRDARDRELAATRRRLDVPQSAAASSEIRTTPSQAALPDTDLSPAEGAAVDRLHATGFKGSAAMMAAIGCLAGKSLAG